MAKSEKKFMVSYRKPGVGEWTAGYQEQTNTCNRCNAHLMVGGNGAIFCNKATEKHILKNE